MTGDLRTPTGAEAVPPGALVEQLRALGVEAGTVLLVHTSFRAVRPVEGGPLGLIEALRAAIGVDGTLVMPSWGERDDQPFDPRTSRASPSLGVVADTFWRLPGVRRSDHPFAFAAAGPLAERIVADPLPLPPHIPESPVGRVHELDGRILLLGVGHDADTTIHLGELLANVPYRVPKHCTVVEDGVPVRVEYGENDHCCRRFVLVDEWLRSDGRQREDRIGSAESRLARSRDVVEVVLHRLVRNPLLFLHEAGACEDCDEARATVVRPRPGSPGPAERSIDVY